MRPIGAFGIVKNRGLRVFDRRFALAAPRRQSVGRYIVVGTFSFPIEAAGADEGVGRGRSPRKRMGRLSLGVRARGFRRRTCIRPRLCRFESRHLRTHSKAGAASCSEELAALRARHPHRDGHRDALPFFPFRRSGASTRFRRFAAERERVVASGRFFPVVSHPKSLSDE